MTLFLSALLVAGTYLPGEGNFDVFVYQTTGERGFREILTSPFTVHAYTNRAPIDVDAASRAAARRARSRLGRGRSRLALLFGRRSGPLASQEAVPVHPVLPYGDGSGEA